MPLKSCACLLPLVEWCLAIGDLCFVARLHNAFCFRIRNTLSLRERSKYLQAP